MNLGVMLQRCELKCRSGEISYGEIMKWEHKASRNLEIDGQASADEPEEAKDGG